jgi:transposase
VKPIDPRSQSYWGAIDIEKLIDADHAARGIWAMVCRLDLRRIEEKIKAVEGRAGPQNTFDPRLLMALWIYAYSEGASVRPRELSRMCDYEPGCQWLTGMQRGESSHAIRFSDRP